MAVTARDVEAAAAAIAGHVVRTPLVPAPRFSEQLGCEAWFKLENLQATGSFKDRGAGNKLDRLMHEAPRPTGVIAASAGNHAQGVALHARRLSIAATIVMPAWTPFSKVERTEALGAAVVQHGESLSDAQQYALELARERGLTFVHPYDDAAIIAGQGTVALEMLQDRPDLDMVVAPIGGGGLIAGIACWIKERHRRVRVVGVQSALCPALHAAVRGAPQPPLRTDTLADGIAVKLPGVLTTPLIKALVDDVVLVDEPALEHAVHALAAQQRIVAEGAGAAAFAAMLADPRPFAGKRVGIVVSGGNIDRRMLSTVLLRGLRHDGKVTRIRIDIVDRPGVLSAVTRLIGAAGADIIDIAHERTFSSLAPRHAELDVVMETRGRAHAETILQQLQAAGHPARLT
jgi:threonine dehydratase